MYGQMRQSSCLEQQDRLPLERRQLARWLLRGKRREAGVVVAESELRPPCIMAKIRTGGEFRY